MLVATHTHLYSVRAHTYNAQIDLIMEFLRINFNIDDDTATVTRTGGEDALAEVLTGAVARAATVGGGNANNEG